MSDNENNGIEYLSTRSEQRASNKMEDCLGKEYVWVDSENFEDYLMYIGIGYVARKAAMALSPTQCLTLNNDGTYTMTFKSRLANGTCTFFLGEEFEETKPGGVKVRSVITIEGNKMTHTQVEQNGRTSTHVREFYPDEMIVTTTAKGWDKVATRRYVLVP